MALVINQEGGMVMPTRKHSQKMSLKKSETKKKMYILGDSIVKHKGLGFVSKIRSSP